MFKPHPVVTRLLDRAGRPAPFDDGRKIALVLFGGMMSGVRGAGAAVALEEMGLREAFDDVYAISAGLPNAAYFLSGGSHLGISLYYEEMCSHEFLSYRRFWKIADIDYAMHAMEEVKPVSFERLLANPAHLHAKLLNTKTHEATYKDLSGLSAEKIKEVMRAAVSLPYLDPGDELVDGEAYKDAGLEKDRCVSDIRYVLKSGATDILAVYNNFEQYALVRDAGIFDSDRLLQIVPYPEEPLPTTCSKPERLKDAAREMGRLVKSQFGQKSLSIDI